MRAVLVLRKEGFCEMEQISGNKIPRALREKSQWIATKEKAPAQREWNKSENWKPYDEVTNCSSPGFCLTDEYVCFDFDHVIGEDGNMCEAAEAFKKRMVDSLGNTYVETSCSRRGLHAMYHIPQKDPLLSGKKINVKLGDGEAHVEVWIGGPITKDGRKTADSNRQIVLTGWQTMDSIDDVTDLPSLDFLRDLEREAKQTQQKKAQPASGIIRHENSVAPILSANEIFQKMRRSKSGDLFQKLFDAGDTSGYPSASEAHLALMNMFPFYCNGNLDKMIEMFKSSALYQNMREEKKNRKDYLVRTAKKALDSWDGVTYSPNFNKKEKAKKGGNAQQACENTEKEKFWPDSDAEGKPIGMTEANLQKLLDFLSIEVSQNDMSKEIEFDGEVFSAIPNDGQRVPNCITKLRGEGMKRGFRVTRDDLTCGIELIAAKNKRNPAREYLLMAKQAYLQVAKDGTEPVNYVKKVFERIHLDKAATEQDANLCYSFFLHWLVGAARAPFNTLEKGDMYQGIIVLVGPQHVGKTRFLKYLVPNQELRSSGLKVDPNDKDSVWRVVRKWGVELGEFGTTMSAKRVEDLKNFITSDRDIFRKPYGKAPMEYARMTFFYASTNQQKFLCDETGDRRYWPIILSYIDLEGWTEEESLLMWGQVMTLAFAPEDDEYKSREPGPVAWWPSDEELDALVKFQGDHKMETEEDTALRDLLDWNAPAELWQNMTVTSLISCLSTHWKGRDLSAVRMGKALTSISMSDSRVGKAQRKMNARGWHVPPLRPELKAEENSIW